MAYQLLPFRFERFNDNEYLLTNEVGEFLFLQNKDFYCLVKGEMDESCDLFYDIVSRQIATTDDAKDVIPMLATKYRTKKKHSKGFYYLAYGSTNLAL